MLSLLEVSSDPTKRPSLVAAITELIDQEVAARGGLTGMAVKGGYKVVKQLKGGQMVPDLVDGLLDEFVGALEPLHAEHRARGGTGFVAFLRSNESRAVNALLGVTDRRAKRTSHALLRSTYEKLRPMAEKQVAESLPGVGRVVDRFCA
jgi:hypothetical protein